MRLLVLQTAGKLVRLEHNATAQGLAFLRFVRGKGICDELLPSFLAIEATIQEQGIRATVQRTLGHVAMKRGDHATAHQWLDAAIELSRKIGDDYVLSLAQWDLAQLLKTSDPRRAIQLMEAVIAYDEHIEHAETAQEAAELAQRRSDYEALREDHPDITPEETAGDDEADITPENPTEE